MLSSSYNEIIGTATVSFLLGWTFKKYNLSRIFTIIRGAPLVRTKLMIVVRPDLHMSKGKLAAQCSHAAVSCYKQSLNSCPDVVKYWEVSGQPKIVLKSDSPGEEGLKGLAKKAADAGLVVALIRDAGRTELRSGTATVLGIGPDYVKKIDSVTANLKIL